MRLSLRGSANSSWRLIFKGSIRAADAGTVLAGTLGPIEFVYGFSLFWLGFVALFFVGGLAGLIGGHGLSFLPLVIIPLVMLAFFFVVTAVASNVALTDWTRMERWLSQLLDLRDRPPS